MKKKLAILAAMMMAATMFASCGDSSSSSTAAETTTAPAESAADTTSSEAETTTAPEESKPEETTEATTEPEPAEPPENAIGIAGISFQVKDSYEYRDFVDTDVKKDKVDAPLNVTCKDTYITGNGDYEVSLEGWWCDFDEADMGWIALDVNLPVEVKDDVASFKDYPDMQIKLTEYQQDGKTFDLSGIDIGLEDNKGTNGMLKVVNGYDNPVADHRGEEYGGHTWQSTDPVVIKFTVSGLPEDKGDEDVVKMYISGTGGEVG